MKLNKACTILLSRVDNLGDAILVLPAAGILKQYYPNCRLLFLGRSYQRAIIDSCQHFDGFLDWDKVNEESTEKQIAFLDAQDIDVIVHFKPKRSIAIAAKKAKIPQRIGSTDRFFHYLTCNHLPIQKRKWSKLHETQLNIRMLAPILKKVDYNLNELVSFFGCNQFAPLPGEIEDILSKNKFNLILHPLTNGHAKEWPLKRFSALIQMLPEERYNILITGTKKEGEKFFSELLKPFQNRICNLTGKLTVAELISLISKADGLVAASTGPLHIAAAASINALGLYVQNRQLSPERYGPVGKFASTLVYDKQCPHCLAGEDCDCIKLISVDRVIDRISTWSKISRCP